jgi:hypothetical protein
MKLKKITGLILLALMSLKTATAEFSIHIPLELKNGGHLPTDSIILGDKNSIPSNPDNEITCLYEVQSATLYIEETVLNEKGEKITNVWAYYYGSAIKNPFKGAEQPPSEFNNNPNVKHFEICFRGEAVILP